MQEFACNHGAGQATLVTFKIYISLELDSCAEIANGVDTLYRWTDIDGQHRPV